MTEDESQSEKATRDYRQHLVLAEQKAQDDYDKSVLALSGGELGISLAFIEKVVGLGPLLRAGLLTAAWLCWAVSIASVLISYFLSRQALRCAVDQVDGKRPEIRRIGGRMALATELANVVSGACFVAGAVLISFFAVANLEAKNAQVTRNAVAKAGATTNGEARLPTAAAPFKDSNH